MNLGPNPTVANPAPTAGEAANIRAAVRAMGRVANTAAGFTSANTVLLADQMGVETDTGKFKLGNGATAWNSLAYAGGNVSDTAYNEATWNGVTDVAPSKNAVRDKIESLAGTLPALTFAGSDPNIPNILVVSRDGASDVSLSRIADYNGYPAWENGANRVAWTAGIWEIIFPGYTVDNVSSNITPVGLTDWDTDIGENQPTVLRGDLISPYLDQRCYASTAIWRWNGAVWIPVELLNGKRITRNDADTAYFSLGVDAIGLPTTTPFP